MIEAGFSSLSQFLNELVNSLVSLLKVAVRGRFVTRLPARQLPVCSVLGNGPSLN